MSKPNAIQRLENVERRLDQLESRAEPKPKPSGSKADSYPRRPNEAAVELITKAFDLLSLTGGPCGCTHIVEEARKMEGGDAVPVKVPSSVIHAILAEHIGCDVRWSTGPALESKATSRDPRVLGRFRDENPDQSKLPLESKQ